MLLVQRCATRTVFHPEGDNVEHAASMKIADVQGLLDALNRVLKVVMMDILSQSDDLFFRETR